jgi:hypothetical protein
MGFASRGCLALVLGATAERRNLFFRSDLGLPWIRGFQSTPMQVKQHEQIEARLAPFMWKTILDTTVLIAEDLGTGSAPLVLTQVEC